MTDAWEADYGLRYDFFTIRSTQFAQGFGAFSPRFKLTRNFGKRANRLRLRRPLLRAVLVRERLAGGGAAAESAAPANARAVRPQARARHAARVRRPRSARRRRARLSRLAEERQRPDRRHPSRRDVAAPGHQLRVGAALARSAQLRRSRSRATDEPISRSRIPSRSTRAARRSCWRRASARRPTSRRPITIRPTPLPAAFYSTIRAAAGSRPTASTAAACRRASARR